MTSGRWHQNTGIFAFKGRVARLVIDTQGAKGTGPAWNRGLPCGLSLRSLSSDSNESLAEEVTGCLEVRKTWQSRWKLGLTFMAKPEGAFYVE